MEGGDAYNVSTVRVVLTLTVLSQLLSVSLLIFIVVCIFGIKLFRFSSLMCDVCLLYVVTHHIKRINRLGAEWDLS